LFRGFQRNRTNWIVTDRRGDLLWELAHMILEAEKFFNMSSASWRNREAGGKLSQVLKSENQP
jgi:hypothetical protein